MKFLASILILLFSCNLVFNQDCGTTTPAYFGNLSDKDYKNKLDKFSAIFYGRIVSQSEPIEKEKGFSFRILKVKVLQAWKGIDSSKVDVEFRYYDNDCLKHGESGELIFYTFSTEQKSFQMDWTSKYSFKDRKTRRILGEGKIITEKSQQQFVFQDETTESF